MLRRYTLLAGIAVLAAALGLVVLAVAAPTPGQRASSAARFVDSIGVNTHTAYSDTAYKRHDLVRARLRDLGVRHLRDGLDPRRLDQLRAIRGLASQGIKATLILGEPGGDGGSLEEHLEPLRQELAGAVAAVEGPNEYDASRRPGWPAALRDYQRRLYSAVKSDPALGGIPVIGPSLIHRLHRPALGDLSEFLDYGNLHSYPGGRSPSQGLSEELRLARRNSGSKPVMATETGYHTAVASKWGQPPVSERAAGIYLPRLYLEYFRRGIHRTFAYELVDERPDLVDASQENNFGLLREDFSPKPAYTALKNLIVILRGSDHRFDPGSLDYSLGGNRAGIGQLLLQKSNGDFYLALWQRSAVWSTRSRTDLRPPPRPVTLELDKPAKRVWIHRPGRSSAPERQLSGVRRLELPVPADVVVLGITPAGKSVAGRLRDAARDLVGKD